jgi:hypothetical protein
MCMSDNDSKSLPLFDVQSEWPKGSQTGQHNSGIQLHIFVRLSRVTVFVYIEATSLNTWSCLTVSERGVTYPISGISAAT